jgi:DNA-binding transcriptional LysR family regulator
MTDIKSLDIFRQIAELGSFQATAQNMGMSLSAISLQMKRLEQFAQLKLFDRSKKPPRLTRDGLIYLEKVNAVLDCWHEIEPHGSTQSRVKHLTIGTVHSVLSSFLPMALKQYRQQMPDLDLVVRLGESYDLETEIQAGTVDAAIVSRPIKPITDINYYDLRSEELALIASPNANGNNAIEILNNNAYVRYNRTARIAIQVEDWFTKHGLDIHSKMEIDTLEGIIALVNAGLGVSVVPMVSPLLFPEDMQIIPLKDAGIRQLVLAIPRISRNIPVLMTFHECLKKAIDDEDQQ